MSTDVAETRVPDAVAALMARRFRGYLPVAIDVECGGFNAATDALLEIAAVLIDMDGAGNLVRGATHSYHVQPFAGARLDPKALAVTGIDPHHPLRPALPERDACSARSATRCAPTDAGVPSWSDTTPPST
jgi:ribonuclease T